MARSGINLGFVRVRTRGLLLLLAGLLLAASAWGRGGGGCLEQGTLIDTPAGPIPIEQLETGATIWAVVDGQLQPATVQATSRVEPAEYVEIGVGGRTLRVTAEHPLQTGPGIFRVAADLQPGDPLYLRVEDHFNRVEVESINRVKAVRPAFNLLVMPGGTYLANGVAVHNKGCFLPDTPIRLADGTETPISAVRPGDELLAFTTAGEIVHTTVRRIITYAVDDYLVVGTEQMTLRVTREHPFYVGNGTFKTLEALKVGDPIFVLLGSGLQEQRITRLETVSAPTRVYNLQTDRPNTYFANGVAVHNKGGSCLPAGTRISTPQGEMAIESLQPGNAVYGIDARGAEVTTAIEFVEATQSALWIIETDLGVLRTTAEHPLLAGNGDFRAAGEFKPGDRMVLCHNGQTGLATVRRITAPEGGQPVYTLRVGPPHTFIAEGFVVHNKGGGGGGFGGGGFYGGSGGGGSGDPTIIFVIFGVIVVIVVVSQFAKKKQEADEDLDYLYSRAEIDGKAVKTRKLLDFLSRVDPTMACGKLEEQALATFQKLQECWQARHYEPMQTLLMPDLYAEHCSQLSGLIGNHEINRIDGLRVEHVDIVNVRYPDKEDDREFTALITAIARDYYLDDRTQEFLRGDEEPARFQEFWTFHRQAGAWLLREIDQTRESDALKEENFFEQFTDTGVKQVYGDQAGQAGPAGPWLDKETEIKATRIERLLNFLVQTDKLWDRPAMLERARQVFLHVTLAREQGDPAAIPAAELFPEVAANLQNHLIGLGAQGTKRCASAPMPKGPSAATDC